MGGAGKKVGMTGEHCWSSHTPRCRPTEGSRRWERQNLDEIRPMETHCLCRDQLAVGVVDRQESQLLEESGQHASVLGTQAQSATSVFLNQI